MFCVHFFVKEEPVLPRWICVYFCDKGAPSCVSVQSAGALVSAIGSILISIVVVPVDTNSVGVVSVIPDNSSCWCN
uniref:Uncharacterized protein n=1 Tax=Pararge aegeria TaxID=116150 RepID=S4NL56_9NEOP